MARTVVFVPDDTLFSRSVCTSDQRCPAIDAAGFDATAVVWPDEIETLERGALVAVDATGGADVDGTVARVRQRLGPVPVLLVVRDETRSSDAVRRLVDDGAVEGLIGIGVSVDLWLSVLQLLLAGGTYLPRELRPTPPVPALADADPAGGPIDGDVGSDAALRELLTPREAQILALLSEGCPNKIIAHDLDLSEHTVKVHLQNLYRKLGVHNRTQAVIVSRRFASDDPSG